MFRNTRGGLSGLGHSKFPTLPGYPFPRDLEMVLDVNEDSELSKKAQMYSNVLESLIAVKYVDLSESHYVQLLKLALYLEEYQCNEEMKKRKIFKQTIQRHPTRKQDETLFKILVKDLDEEREWIRDGDFVDVIDTRTYTTYTLRVTFIGKADVIASDDAKKLCKAFEPTVLYDINFRFQNYPLRCAHYALWLTYKESVITYVFPQKSKPFINMENKSYDSLTMLNPNVDTNPEQKQAVLNIVNKSSFPAPYILYGPPGTGKTATLVEAICQIHKACPSNRILVCTPSNTAADEIARRLLKFLTPSDMYRVYSQSKDGSTVDKELKNCSYYGGPLKTPLRREDIAQKAILITTLCGATRFVLMKLSVNYFSHIIIDEAGQGTEPDMLIPISIASKSGQLYSQIVLAGDPQQLGPTVISKLAEILLGRSILERLMSYDTYQKDCYNNYNPKYITKLLHNYRSHRSIIDISSKLFYDNELVPKFASDDQKVNFPIIFHGVEGIERKYSYSPSTCNYEEIKLVFKYVYDLIDNKTEFGEVTAKDIGIVTPFKLQSKRIKEILLKKDCEERKELENKTEKEMKILENPKKGGKSKLKSEDAKDIEVNDESKLDNENAKGMDVKVDDDKDPEIDGWIKLEFETQSDDVTDDDKIKLKIKNEKDPKPNIDGDESKLQIKNERDLEPKIDNDENKIEFNNLEDADEKTDIDLNLDDSKDVLEGEDEKIDLNVGKVNDKRNRRKRKGKNVKPKIEKNNNEIKCRDLKDINVGTVELFQGQERKIMIMTAVRSKTFFCDGKEHIGFLSNPKRFNVAMTRAQNALIVIGNPGILQKDDMWQYLLKYCIDNNSYRGFKFALRKLCTEKPVISDSGNIATSASLFQETPFKLFLLDDQDSELDVSRTVDHFVEPEKDELAEQAQQHFRELFNNMNLSTLPYL